MAHYTRISLLGEFAVATTIFLRENGFENVPGCSDKSIWAAWGFLLYLDRDEMILNYDTLFRKIYTQGRVDGVRVGKETLKNEAIRNITDMLFVGESRTKNTYG